MCSDIFYFFINQSQIVTHVDDIVYVESRYIPNKSMQSSQHIRGWIDIIGFEGTVRINDAEYSNASKPVILYDVWDEGITSSEYITNNNVDFIKITDERITTVDNITSVEIDIHMMWHHSVLKSRNGRPYISKKYHHEYTTFTTSRAAAQSYPDLIIPELNVIVYNNTIAPKTIIYLKETDFILGYRLEYDNESVEYFNNVLSVETQGNGFPYGNMTKVLSQSIYEDSDMFSRAGPNIIINSTEIDDSLRIYAFSPYNEYEINQTVTNYSEKRMLDNVQLSSAFGLLMLIWMIVFLVKYHRR